jgi:alpha-1,3-mannosyltransferase
MASSSATKTRNALRTIAKQNYDFFSKTQWDYPFLALLLLGELALGSLIIYKVPYTEIDWIAYMEEVNWWLGGEYDYMKIYGNTGPLVYPAGFLYLFGFLQWMTDGKIPQAQIIFLLFYILTQASVVILYTIALRSLSIANNSNQVWSFRVAMGCLCISKRFHSIFLLRLFNDGPTMLMAYLSFICFLKKRWNLGCFIFSLAVSLKMNILLFAPGLLFLLIQDSVAMTIPRLAICAVTQLVIGAPFLLRHPISYFRKAFELDRQFFFKWTVNLKFLPEDLFLSKHLAVLLLFLHLSLLGIYFFRLYKSTSQLMTAESMLSTLFVSNFIGICCARTLHYQFYSWYFSSLPFLLWRETFYPLPIRVLLLICIEYAFLTFPATPASSIILQLAHWSILIPCVFFGRRGNRQGKKEH